MESIFDGVASVVFEKAKATERMPACLRIQVCWPPLRSLFLADH